ncbi:MAG: AI-2E family transporter [Bacteroidota bacterium]
MVQFFNRFVSMSLSVAITTVLTLGIFFVIGFGLYNVIQALVENSETILNSISTDVRPFINSYLEYFGFSIKPGQLGSGIVELLQTGSFWSASGSFFTSISGFTAELLMTILYFAGLLSAIANYDESIKYIVGSSPGHERKAATDALKKIKNSVSSYIIVKTYVSLITGVAIGLICWFFGIDYSLLWGFVAFVLNYIPYIGSLIAIVPPIVLGIISFGNISQVVFLFVCLEGVQLVMGNVIEPKLMGDSFSINTVSVLFGFVFWAFMWGTAGMLLAVPLTFMIKVILENLSGGGVMVRLMEKKKLST